MALSWLGSIEAYLHLSKYSFERADGLLVVPFATEKLTYRVFILAPDSDLEKPGFFMIAGLFGVNVHPDRRIEALEKINEINVRLAIGSYELYGGTEDQALSLMFKVGCEVRPEAEIIRMTMDRVIDAMAAAEDNAISLIGPIHRLTAISP